MSSHSDSVHHWRYFLALDEDLLKISRYIELCEANSNCYSIEIARILMMASAEAEVVAKQLVQRISSTLEPQNMGACREILAKNFCELPSVQVRTLVGQFNFTPWADWANGTRPSWWKAYTDIKHARHTHFSQGNLKNALEAVCGLMVLIVYLYEKPALQGQLYPTSRLFSFGSPVITDRDFWNQSRESYKIERSA